MARSVISETTKAELRASFEKSYPEVTIEEGEWEKFWEQHSAAIERRTNEYDSMRSKVEFAYESIGVSLASCEDRAAAEFATCVAVATATSSGIFLPIALALCAREHQEDLKDCRN